MVEKLSEEDRRVVPFFGVHPWYADKLPADWYETLQNFLKSNPAAGVGEVGLDKARNVDLARQTEVLHRQLEIAGRLKRPLAIHCVRAWSDLVSILKRSLPSKTRFMIHSFQGSPQVLKDLLNLGGYISFSWKSLQRDTEESIALMRSVPLDRLLLETDFPYTEPGRIGAEKVFHLIQERDEGDLDAAVESADRLLRAKSERVRAMNVALTEGEQIYASCRYDESPDYFTLHYREGDVAAVCSEPLDASYVPMANGERRVI